nr:unnamed protein product [Digitaria exilis]
MAAAGRAGQAGCPDRRACTALAWASLRVRAVGWVVSPADPSLAGRMHAAGRGSRSSSSSRTMASLASHAMRDGSEMRDRGGDNYSCAVVRCAAAVTNAGSLDVVHVAAARQLCSIGSAGTVVGAGRPRCLPVVSQHARTHAPCRSVDLDELARAADAGSRARAAIGRPNGLQ